MNETYETKMFGEAYQIRADWAESACPVEIDAEGGWVPTGWQVASYGHSPRMAMKLVLIDAIIASGDDPDDEEMAAAIDDAIEEMVEVDKG